MVTRYICKSYLRSFPLLFDPEIVIQDWADSKSAVTFSNAGMVGTNHVRKNTGSRRFMATLQSNSILRGAQLIT